MKPSGHLSTEFFRLPLARDQRQPPGKLDCFFALDFLGLTLNGQLLSLPLGLQGDLGMCEWCHQEWSTVGPLKARCCGLVPFIPSRPHRRPARVTWRNLSPLSLSCSSSGFVKQGALGPLVQVLGTAGTWPLVFSGEGECHG